MTQNKEFSNVEAIDKFANKEVSLIVEPLIGFKAGENGKTFNRIGFILIKRKVDNSAKGVYRFYFDMPAIKLLAYDVIVNRSKPEWSEYKTVGKNARTIKINVHNGKVSVAVNNGPAGTKDLPGAFIPLTIQNFRRLMLACLDFVRNFELARHISGKAYEQIPRPQQQSTPETGWGNQAQAQAQAQTPPPQQQAPPPAQSQNSPPWENGPGMDEPPF